MNLKEIQNVVAAIIKKNNLYFIAQRNKHKHLGLKWEFPGGKVHLNESFKEALLREIKEEYYGKKESESDYIFNVKTFANGFNSLLEQSKLKSVKIGDKWKRRDAVSLRHTYIVFKIQNNISEFIIGKNVGTSGKMIYENYTKNLKTLALVDRLTNVNSTSQRKSRLVVIK